MTGYTTINEIVKNALIDIGESTEHLYQRFLHWALEGLKDYHFDTAKEIKTVSIPMNPDKTIDFPPDYVDWVKFGIVIGDRVKTFAVNHKLALREDRDECGNPILPGTSGDTVNHFTADANAGGYWFHNYLGCSLFSHGGACFNIGFYRIDRAKRQIAFSSEVRTTDVYLEYITNGINPSGETVVHEYAAKLIKYYILWVRKECSDKYSDAEAERARSLYYNELRMVRARMSSFDIADFIEATKKSYLGRIQYPRFIQKTKKQVVIPTAVTDECPDVFIPPGSETPSDGKKRFWGVSSNSSINDSSGILSLQSEYGADRIMTKTLDATGGKYLYFAYPVAYGQATFLFNTYPTTFLEQVLNFTDGTNPAEDYYVYRSLNLQHGADLTIEIQ